MREYILCKEFSPAGRTKLDMIKLIERNINLQQKAAL
jgi:hypothetical protein